MQFLDENTVNSLLNALDSSPFLGLRINRNKIDNRTIEKFFPFLEKHPFLNEGYIYHEKMSLGNHPLHHAGAFYMQEPSAMMVAGILDCDCNDRILDVCAAPGGKATYIGLKLGNNGVLIANDSSYKRACILSENVERMGLSNTFVTANTIEQISTAYSAYFDKIILDAPCSGSGMFRKNKAMMEDWSIDKVFRCQSIQKDLILKSYRLLKKGGIMVYSTCSFSKEENEDVINYLRQNTHAQLLPIKEYPGIDRGLKMPEAIRLYPHHFAGEGHFIALIQSQDDYLSHQRQNRKKQMPSNLKPFFDFIKTFSTVNIDENRMYLNGSHLHYLPKSSVDVPSLFLLRCGLHLGEIIKDRFEPSHALALATKVSDWKIVINFPADSAEIKAYLHGDSLAVSSTENGYCLVCCENISIGFGKITNKIMKNHYPKGLRTK